MRSTYSRSPVMLDRASRRRFLGATLCNPGTHGHHLRILSEFEPFQFYVVAANLGKVILSLLDKPAFFRASKNLGYSHGHFGRYAALPVYEFRKRVTRHPKGGGGVRDRQA